MRFFNNNNSQSKKLFGKSKEERIYLDYASTTPVDSRVFDAMAPYFSEKFSNPSSLYKEGVLIKKVIEDCRLKVSRILKARLNDVYFTGSGTESNNLALLGLFENYKNKIEKPHIIVSKIEHPAIIEVAKEIEKRGGEVTYLSVNEKGLVNLDELQKALKAETILVSIMYANNEIGTIEPLGKIARIIKKFRKENETQLPYFHTDASQAPNYLDCNVEKLGVDLMTLDGSKIYGPKGVGCLYKKHNVQLKPIMFGGGQESGLRPATENVAGIVGFAKAFEIAQENFEAEFDRMKELQKYFIEQLSNKISQATLNGAIEDRLPNNINICIPGINAEFAVIQLDEKGIACASMTACKNLDDESRSYVIEALREDESRSDSSKDCAISSLRFSMGRKTTKKEIDLTIKKLKVILA